MADLSIGTDSMFAKLLAKQMLSFREVLPGVRVHLTGHQTYLFRVNLQAESLF